MTEHKNQFTKCTIRCGHCGNKTLMIILAEGEHRKNTKFDKDTGYEAWIEYKILTLLCTNCQEINIIQISHDWDKYTDMQFDKPDWELLETVYLYPMSQDFADTSSKAQDIRDTYREANTCFKAELYTSSVVMCRKTMEMLCLYFEIEQPHTLDGKLAKMRGKEIIDNKLYEWAKALKHFGNEAVHSSIHFSKEDAKDILDFTYALVEYCIDFDYKFEQLLQRRGKPKPSSGVEPNTLTQEIVNQLLQSLNANEISVRYYAATTLAQKNIELEQAVPVLLNLTEKSKFSSNAANCLKSIGSKAIPQLINALESHISNNVRSAAATILGDIGANNPDVIVSLVQALKYANDDVQYKAGLALEKLGVTSVDIFAKIYNL
ncbi:hypothetical protein NIES2101_09435 [Calothrix sp. HK-06]|nr:hypothetical protein NIES2101_09435 [Calothrix sp. HK-06]